MWYPPRVVFGRWGQDQRRDVRRLRAILECVTQQNVISMMEDPSIPSLGQAALLEGVHYDKRPLTIMDGGDPGFGDVYAILEKRGVACGWLGPYRAADLRFRHGIHAWCDVTIWRDANGDTVQHITVNRPDGPPEDPSSLLGMR